MPLSSPLQLADRNAAHKSRGNNRFARFMICSFVSWTVCRRTKGCRKRWKATTKCSALFQAPKWSAIAAGSEQPGDRTVSSRSGLLYRWTTFAANAFRPPRRHGQHTCVYSGIRMGGLRLHILSDTVLSDPHCSMHLLGKHRHLDVILREPDIARTAKRRYPSRCSSRCGEESRSKGRNSL